MTLNKTFVSYTLLINSLVLNNYKNFLLTQILNILKFYLPLELSIQIFNIKYLFKLLFFNFIKIEENITPDNLQKLNPVIQLNLPIKIINLKTTKTIIKIISVGELPLINLNSFLILNGLSRSLISKIKKTKGLYFFKRTKGNQIIFLAQLIISDFDILQIEITPLGFVYIYSKLIPRIDFFLFLNLLGIHTNWIISFSKYGTNYILKRALLFSLYNYRKVKKKKIVYLKILKILKLNVSLLNIDSNLFLLKALQKNFLTSDVAKYQLKFKYFNFYLNQNTLLALEFLQIYDLLIDLKFNKISHQNIDHVGNKHLESISTFLNTQFNLAVCRNFKHIQQQFFSAKVVKKNFSKFHLPKHFITLKEQLNINPLIQYLEQINVLSENMHKTRITYIDQQILKTIKGNINLREIRPSQLGKFCLINTTEGEKSGLILSLAMNCIQTKKGAVKSPFYTDRKTTTTPHFLGSFDQELYQITFTGRNYRKNFIFDNYLSIVFEKGEFRNTKILHEKFLYLKLADLFSLSENMIPFLIYNDPTRCLMGSKMQMQSVPLLFKHSPYILTGLEMVLSNTTNKALFSMNEGIITYVSSSKIIIRDTLNREIFYFLNKYKSSNQGILFNMKPIVWVGERILSGQKLAVNLDINHSEFNIGHNLLVAYGSFFGFEFEDSLIINKDIIYNNLFTSLHIEEFKTKLNKSRDELEYSVMKLPKYNKYLLRHLDTYGLIKEGSRIVTNDILVAKIKLKKTKLFETALHNFIFLLVGKNIRSVENNSLTVPKGCSGRVIKLEVLKKTNLLHLRIFIARINLLESGDKLCGRHGNKGVVSLLTEPANLPYNPEGYVPDLITGPLGVPSRMNLGQLYESLLGLSSFFLDKRILITPDINQFLGTNFTKLFIYQNLYKSKELTNLNSLFNPYVLGQGFFRNGFTGCNLKKSLFYGNVYYSKLIHMVKQKIHARTLGPYSEITQQPLKGRAKGGGQRFGEMEVWALEAFGAAYNLREILGYKSDSFVGRYHLNKYLFDNKFLELPTIPEAFKLMTRELNGLSLNINSFVLSNYLYGKKVSLNLNF